MLRAHGDGQGENACATPWRARHSRQCTCSRDAGSGSRSSRARRHARRDGSLIALPAAERADLVVERLRALRGVGAVDDDLGPLFQERLGDGAPKDSHPLFRPHLMQGWTPDFIPKLTEDAVDAKYIDDILPISGDDAMRLSRSLATEEGIFVGVSAGATLLL